MKRILIALILIVVAGLAVYGYLQTRPQRNPNLINISGNIEITEVQVSFKIPGRVEERLVDEGQTVQAKQIVARLDSKDLTQELAIRKAEFQVAQAALAAMLAGSRPQEIAAAKAVVQSAQVNLTNAQDNHRRIKELYQRKLVAQQEFDNAEARVQTAQAQLNEAHERLKLIQEGPRKEDIEQARARTDQARSAMELAEIRLGYATLRSPISGVVLSKNIEPGEYVVPGTPIITVGDLVNAWLRVYIDETDLGRIKLGQRVHIKTDTYPDKVYDGRVSFISSEAEFTPKNVQTEKERVKLVYRVKIDVKNPQMELKPGMPADAVILLGTEHHDQRDKD